MMSTKFNYEKSLERLEEINSLLSQGNISLEQSLALYEEGAKLAVACKKEIEAAQKKIAEVKIVE